MTNFHIRHKTTLPPLAFDLYHDADTREAEPIRKQNFKTIHVSVVSKKGRKRVTYKAPVGVESRPSAAKLLEDYLEGKNQACKMRNDEGPPEEPEETPKKAKKKRKRSLQNLSRLQD